MSQKESLLLSKKITGMNGDRFIFTTPLPMRLILLSLLVPGFRYRRRPAACVTVGNELDAAG